MHCDYIIVKTYAVCCSYGLSENAQEKMKLLSR